ncbi:Cysteine-rich receptor-kinase-like protein [Melia azedarach]|uniref:Cysteine-rich receptor-kinase-like protein n=1 Tax=Melia azedarach TaxID=155640 RepID=A0ACC1WW24_MELAZ|nr:Cysteine-rich receptor-kinase-like protein [Melia azedarach]
MATMLTVRLFGSRTIHIISLLHLLSFLLQSSSDAEIQPTYVYNSCSRVSNNTAPGYEYNLGKLHGKFTEEGGKSRYNKASEGDYPDKIYGLYLCKFDISYKLCQDCIDVAIDSFYRNCTGTREAIVWYDECLVRFSNRSFASTRETSPYLCMWNVNNVTEPATFSKLLSLSFDDLIRNAPSNHFDYAAQTISSFQNLYTLAQCLPYLSTSNCTICLKEAVAEIQSCCYGRQGGRVFFPSCYIRYEMYPFFNVSADGASGPALPPSNNDIDPGKKRKKDGRTWIAITSSVSAIVLLLLSSSFLWFRKRRNRRVKEEKASSQEVQLLHMGERRIGNDFSSDIIQGDQQSESQAFPLFSLELTLKATQHFSDENKLGEGGFGPVYKGVLADGKEIAVKRLSRTSGQGLQEFKNEVTVIAKLQHKNLVRLLGCCLEETESLLIYEYMPNRSLDVFLFDSTRRVQLDWKRRLSIINGIARGIMYLHEDSRLRIIHRDLKASNVLLDHEMNPKISDFGMARIFGGNQSEANTNRVVGTYGYMAPEYAMEGLFSIKSDVFSFGVLLLEIISGSKNGGFYHLEHGQSLLTYTWKLWCNGEALELMDPVIKQSCVPGELLKFIHIGLLCVQEDPTDRPTMSSVVVMLASETVTLTQPTQPAFSVGRVMARPVQSASDDKLCSVNEVTISNVSPR